MTDKRLRIGVDLDGVVSDWTGAFGLLCEQVFNRPFPRTATTWGLANFNLTKEELKQAWDVMCSQPCFYSSLRPFEDAAFSDMYSFSQKHVLFFVTSRPMTNGEPIEVQSAQWVRDMFGLRYPTVVVTENKGAVAAALGLHAFIDDKPENLADIRKHAPECRLFMRTWEYNQVIDEALLPVGSYQRVLSFAQFVAIMNGMSERP